MRATTSDYRTGCSRLESRSIPSFHRAIDYVHRLFARQHTADFAPRSRLKADQGLLAVPGDVRRDDDIVASTQWMRIGQWLRVRRVEGAAGNLLRVERANERVGVNNRSARAIDEEGAWLHVRQGFVVDHLPRLRGQRRMERDEGRRLQQPGKLHLLSR